MKRNTVIFITLVSVLMVLSSCKDQKQPEDVPPKDGPETVVDSGKMALLAERTEIGIYGPDTAPLFLMDEAANDLVWGSAESVFILRSDDSSVYSVRLGSTDGEDFCQADIVSSLPSFESRSAKMKLVKEEGDLVWLWDEQNTFGLVIFRENMTDEESAAFETQFLELVLRHPGQPEGSSAEAGSLVIDDTDW